MTLPLVIIIVIVNTFIFTTTFVLVDGLGSASTAAVVYGTGTVCGIVAGQPTQSIQCYNPKSQLLFISVLPNVSFQEISGGRSFFCGLRDGGFSLHCWDTSNCTTAVTNTLQPKRIYHSHTVALTYLAIGDSQVCALELNTGIAKCWRGGGLSNDNEKVWSDSPFPSPGKSLRFQTISCGSGFTCGILKNDSRVVCWGLAIADEIQMGFENFSMSSLVAGESHACGLTTAGFLVCRGRNGSSQLDVPLVFTNSAYEFSGLALGSVFTCGIKRQNGLVTCWGELSHSLNNVIKNVSFELIVSGSDFVCGLTTSNLTMLCWSGAGHYSSLPMGMILPGPCVKSYQCSKCGTYPNSDLLCHYTGDVICKACQVENLPLAVPVLPPILAPSPPSDHDHDHDLQSGDSFSSKAEKKLLLTFLIVGSIGSSVGFSSIVYCLWSNRILRSYQRATNNEDESRNSISTTDHNGPSTANNIVSILNSTGSSNPEIFSLSELAAATNNFSLENKIGGGSFGVVHRGKLSDGREVAIKRGHTHITSSQTITGSSSKMMVKQFQEKEIAFDSELASLSRLNHKHLVSLVGFCRENDERLLVYDYMTNGSLHHLLHDGKYCSNDKKNDCVLIINSWRARIKIALDAAKGIEYLHNYAVPPVIHRDIKSSNILLDSDWTARVSDFGLSTLMKRGQHDVVSAKAVGTVGYIDPEYYVLNVLTAKSDVYGLGVVMLELLTGKKAVFKDGEEGLTSVVDYARERRRLLGEGVLDKRVRSPEWINEAEAVEILADTAVRCVKLEGNDRPDIAEVVSSLERAFSLCNV
ncbi:putative serine/threonine-protein kinase-like protein CCR3 [Humulus lupulus]|uniref:putative serine/threonine-protein kinase-like protein CCR3 n=1 Tax=Humulus lupulus TaxID=3486 RepID=UPI002B40464B|nr:putative serine/threonine-protein kinase-like protein CCR3 [Humulus lupulus]